MSPFYVNLFDLSSSVSYILFFIYIPTNPGPWTTWERRLCGFTACCIKKRKKKKRKQHTVHLHWWQPVPLYPVCSLTSTLYSGGISKTWLSIWAIQLWMSKPDGSYESLLYELFAHHHLDGSSLSSWNWNSQMVDKRLFDSRRKENLSESHDHEISS